MREELGKAFTCIDELEKITACVKYVAWPIESDVKQYFVPQMFHLINANQLWEEIGHAIDGKTLVTVASDTSMMSKIHQSLYDFEYIKKGIEEKICLWKRAFPRFFLLSHEKIFDVMEDFPKMEAISTLFSVKSLKMLNEKEICGFVSNTGEELRLIHPVCTKECPCLALKKLEESMRETVKEEIMSALKTRALKKEWYLKNLRQAIAVSLWVEWTRNVEEALKGKDPVTGFANCLELYNNELKIVIKLIQEVTDPEEVVKMKYITMILYNFVRMIEQLIKEKVKTEYDAAWLNTLKFYWKNNTILVKCGDSIVEYGYEFNSVDLPLVYMPESIGTSFPFIMSSIKHQIIAGLAGPAGTGKTEMCKELATLLGKPYVVLNVSDSVSVEFIENFTRAISYMGGFLILDELNRLNSEKKWFEHYYKLMELREAGCCELVEEGKSIPLGKNFDLIATINPGYMGRTTFPNVETVPVTVLPIIPLCEATFLSEGFINGKTLASKMCACFTELKNKLSKAHHYDFGVRVHKRIIALVKLLVNKYKLPEEVALSQAFYITVWTHLEKGDIKLFEDVMKATFGEKVAPLELNSGLFKVLAESGKKLPEKMVYQLVYLYEIMRASFSPLLLVPDEKIISVLVEAIAKLYPTEVPTVHVIDISLPSAEVFGKFEDAGYVSGSFDKTLMSLDGTKENWLVLTKSVSAVKTENFNTLIDVGRKYCSMAGTMKTINEKTKIIFVATDLENASPAFVSRTAPFKFE